MDDAMPPSARKDARVKKVDRRTPMEYPAGFSILLWRIKHGCDSASH
jgi:hypothetical protein